MSLAVVADAGHLYMSLAVVADAGHTVNVVNSELLYA